MPPIETIDSNSSEQSTNNWYLVSVRSKKREVFLSFIEYQSQLDTLVFNNIFLYLTGVRYRS